MSPLSAILKKYIRIPSVTTDENLHMAKAVAKDMALAGCKVRMQKIRYRNDWYWNVAGWKGPKSGAPLLLCSHLDTVPPGEKFKWTKTGRNPWRATQIGSKVYGLGAADDKGPLVAMLDAIRRVSSKSLRRPVLFLGTFGEESGMGGAKSFVREWKLAKPCLAIVGEPTDLKVTYRHKGIGVVVITLRVPEAALRKNIKVRPHEFKGKQGHSSRPWTGDNALEKAMGYLKKQKNLNDLYVTDLRGGHAANLIPGHASMAVCSVPTRSEEPVKGAIPARAVLAAYESVQTVLKKLQTKNDRSFYPSCVTSNFGVARFEHGVMTLVFDFRLLPGITIGPVHQNLKQALTHRAVDFSGVRCVAEIERENPPLDAERIDPAAREACRLLKMSGLPVSLEVKPSCTEAGVYARWGVPAFIFGPGKAQGNIHAPNEYVDLKQVKKAAHFYARAIQSICVEGDKCF